MIRRLVTFAVLALHQGRLAFLDSPDLSSEVRAGEALVGDDVRLRGGRLVAHLRACVGEDCNRTSRAIPW